MMLWSNIPRNAEHKTEIQFDSNLTIFAALLKNIPMECPFSVLTEPLLRHTQVNCLLSNQTRNHTKIICVLSSQTDTLISHFSLQNFTDSYFTEIITKTDYDPKSFRRVSVENLLVIEEVVQRSSFIYNFDVKEGEHRGELDRRNL